MCDVCGTELKIARIKAVAANVTVPKGMTTLRDDNGLNTWFEVWADGKMVIQKFTCCAYDAKRTYIDRLVEDAKETV